MRHLISVALAVVGGVAIFVCLGVGDIRTRKAMLEPTVAERAASLDLALGVGLLVVAGLCYGFLLLSRISPAGPVLLGAVFATVAVLEMVSPATYVRLLPARVLGIDGVRAAIPSTTLMLAVPLLLTGFVFRRWRADEAEQEAYLHPLDATW
jgi:hypothetical protein